MYFFKVHMLKVFVIICDNIVKYYTSSESQKGL